MQSNGQMINYKFKIQIVKMIFTFIMIMITIIQNIDCAVLGKKTSTMVAIIPFI